MFDIGFWEIVLICVVALLVVGPERMPGLVREVARWTNTARRFIANARREFETQLSTLEMDVKIKDPLPRNFEESLAKMDDLMKSAPDRQDPPAKESKPG